MMSTKFWDILTPSPCPRLELIYTKKIMQPPLPHFHEPPPPQVWTSLMDGAFTPRWQRPKTSLVRNVVDEINSIAMFCIS